MRALWRVDYYTHAGTGPCGWRSAGWWKTRKAAQKFIDEKAALPCRIVKDMRPSTHPEWPKEPSR
jgi:hypothetical protein